MKKSIVIVGVVLVLSVSIFIIVNLNKGTIKSIDVGDGTSESAEAWNGDVVEVEIKASNWKFEPGLVEVNLGDKVELHLESTEGTHGIAIPEYRIGERLEPGKDVHVEFIADEKGTFGFYCSVPCGNGHSGMNGILVVK